MKNTLSQLKIYKTILFIIMAGVLLFIGSCMPDTTDPTPDPTPTNNEMYIKFQGKKVICKVPANDYRTYVNSLGDTGVTWEGNLPAGDTIFSLGHHGQRIVGKKYVLKFFSTNPEDVMVNITWSSFSTAPKIIIDGGDYTLEKINGKWVSTLKNGLGYNGRNSSERYTGIEFRMIWP